MDRSDVLKIGVSCVVVLAALTAGVVRYRATASAHALHGDRDLPALPLGPTDSATIDAVETEGSRFPRDPVIADYQLRPLVAIRVA